MSGAARSEGRSRRHRRGADSASGRRNTLALSLTKSGDSIVDPKLILAWLLGHFGAPAWMIGALVPVREALALFPQTVLAPFVERAGQARWFWIAGAVGQGLAAFAMGAAALLAPSHALGWIILIALVVFSLSRSLSSVSYKRVLGASVEQGDRGTVTGRAKSISSAFRFLFASAIAVGLLVPSPELIGGALACAAVAWAIAGGVMAGLDEAPKAADDDGARVTLSAYWSQFSILKSDAQLRRLLAVRGLLTVTALAPPYVAALSGQGAERISLEALGPLLLVSAAASTLSAARWGRLSDRSSARALQIASWAAAGLLAISASLAMLNGGRLSLPVVAALLFALTIAYEGVRAGRSTHLVDMAPPDARAAYAAVANTVIGVVLLGAGALGVVGQAVGAGGALAVFAALSALAGVLAAGLRDVQAKPEAANS